ncbi:AP-2 complex subunit alpha [Nesidiocoris tenuis]|uniref:AP-2 complex subunit alpha n=2 Tax=Nesidiocoris tenuis TaxID=355587 RepID=A0ABN7ALY0_9HEMI|nr:AP-2 complex subunit alpha [Nesidiocoris tenuis]
MAGAIVDFFGFQLYDANLPREPKMRGVYKFTLKIRQCRTCEEEDETINEELAKIRNVLNSQIIDCYMKKKSICKLIYIFLLGRKIDFGHTVALSLLSSNVFSEKRMGYLFISLVFSSESSMDKLLIRCIKSDLASGNMKFIHVALQCVSSYCNNAMASELMSSIVDLINSSISDDVLKSVLLCTNRFVEILDDEVTSRLLDLSIRLISHEDLGVVSCASTLIESIVKWANSTVGERNKTQIMHILTLELRRILSCSRPGLREYEYHKVTACWVMVKMLRCMRELGTVDRCTSSILNDNVENILNKCEVALELRKPAVKPDVKTFNATFMALSEVSALVAADSRLFCQIEQILSRLLAMNEPNLVLVAVESARNMATSKLFPRPSPLIREMICFLAHRDKTLPLAIIDLLSDTCSTEDIPDIADRLLSFLTSTPPETAAAAAPKVAQLFQRAVTNPDSYIDIMVDLHNIAGQNLDDKVTFDFVKTLQTFDSVRLRRAALKIFDCLSRAATSDQRMIQLAATVLGQWDLDDESLVLAEWMALTSAFKRCRSTVTRAQLLTCFLRISHRHRSFLSRAIVLFEESSRAYDVEIQQRSVEYIKLLELPEETSEAIIGSKKPMILRKIQNSVIM